MKEFGDYVAYKLSPFPEYDLISQEIKEVEPVLIGEEYVQQWKVVDLPKVQVDSNLAQSKYLLKQTLKSNFENSLSQGVDVDGIKVQIDNASITNLSVLYSQAVANKQLEITSEIPFRDADNKVHQLTSDEIISLFAGAKNKHNELISAYWQKKDEINAADTVEKFRAIKFD